MKWQPINEKNNCCKFKFPKFEWKGGLFEKSKSQFCNVSMLEFYYTTLMVSMRTNNHMKNSMDILDLNSPINLDTFKFGVKLSFCHGFKLLKQKMHLIYISKYIMKRHPQK